jgi:hypothetical protein
MMFKSVVFLLLILIIDRFNIQDTNNDNEDDRGDGPFDKPN